MKIVDKNRKLQSSEPKNSGIQHEIGEKLSLSKKVDIQSLEKGVKRSVKELDNKPKPRTENIVPQAKKPIPKKNLRPANRGKLNARKYTVLNNNGVLPKSELRKSRPRSLQKSVTDEARRSNLRKMRLAKKPNSKRIFKFKIKGKLSSVPSSGNAKGALLEKAKSANSIARKAGGAAAIPIRAMKDRALRADKENGDTGIEGAKMGLRGVDRTVGEARKIKSAVNHTKDGVRFIQKRINRTGKSAKRSLKTGKRTANAAKRGFKTAAKTARNAKQIAKATAKAVKVGVKITVKVAKAAVQAVKQIVSFIAETAPWSLIVIAILVVIILLYMLISMLISSIQGTTTGAGAWAFDDATTPEQAYKNYEVYIDNSDKCIDNRVQNPFKGIVDSSCENDTEKPHLIIQYIENDSLNVTFFPAYGKNNIIDKYIDEFDDGFGAEFYSKFLATLFVLMTRDKQNAEGVSDIEIFDFSFKIEDFEEFIGRINSNTCKYGETYIYKETETLHNQPCPGEDCELQYFTEDEPGEPCASTQNEETGETEYYCEGHPYCPETHDKLIIRLYTIEKLHKSDVATIYNFTENEKIRYEAVQAFMQGLIDSYGGDTP